MTQPVVVVDDVHLSFAGVQALRAVSFEVVGGGLFAVIGPNGAGKTSIFNVLSGVYRPQRGSVRFLGSDIIGVRPDVIAGMGMARTFQNIELFENLTVVDNLMLGRHQHSAYGVVSALLWNGRARRDEVRNRSAVEEIIDFLDIAEHRDTPVGLLPYGIQKRIELVRALLAAPRVLLLDEPAAGLNPVETEALHHALEAIAARGVTLVVVEHDMHFVGRLCPRVVVLNFGQKIAECPTGDIHADRGVREAYLGAEDHAA